MQRHPKRLRQQWVSPLALVLCGILAVCGTARSDAVRRSAAATPEGTYGREGFLCPYGHTTSGAATAPALRQYDSPYYVIHSDLGEEVVREARVRLTAMAEEYRRRTKAFGPTTKPRLPFYLYRSRSDYYRAGGLRGTAGFYNGKALVAAAMGRTMTGLWRTLQHEGFHQFAHRVLGGRMPIWLNEGLAEYFAEGLWTGDGFVTGLIRPQRLERIKTLIRTKQLVPLGDMLNLDQKTWISAVQVRHYDQAWSMVHFLVHGDSGRYRKALLGFIHDLSRSQPAQRSFESRFGRDHGALEKRYAGWWLALGSDPAADLRTQATVAALTSFLARAHLQGLRFRSAEEFFAAAKADKIQTAPRGHERLYLPGSLLKQHLSNAGRMATWSLQTHSGSPTLKLAEPDGTTFVGQFLLRGEERPAVTVTTKRAATP